MQHRDTSSTMDLRQDFCWDAENVDNRAQRPEAGARRPATLAIPDWMTRDEQAAEEAFAAGDYTRAAQLAESGELKGCALILLGIHEQGLPLVEGHPSPRARFFAAFALWGLAYDARATALLSGIIDPVYGPQARHLEQLIRRPKIRILLQGRDDPGCPDYDIVGAFRSIPQADIKTVGYWSGCDVVIDHTTTFDEVMAALPAGWMPDLFLSHMVEDYPPPIGIEKAPFPTICHTQDFDRHFHHCGHFLKQFDATIALGSADHDDFRRLTGSAAFVFPKLLGVGKSPRGCGGPRRDIDVFVSGSLFTLSRQKAQYLFDVSQLPAQYQVEMLEGYTSPEDYYQRLSQAKATFTYVHRWGLINGRAIEAISVGTCAVYQEGGELGLFLSEEEGAIPYQPHNAMDVLTRVIEQWDDKYCAYARNGSRRVAKVFSLENCIERYYHFLAFLLTQNIQKHQRAREPVFSEMRWPNRSPERIMGAFEHSVPKLAALQAGFRQHWEDSERYEHLDAVGESWLYSYLLEKRCPLPPEPAEATAPEPVVTAPTAEAPQPPVGLRRRVARKLGRIGRRFPGGSLLVQVARKLAGFEVRKPSAPPCAVEPRTPEEPCVEIEAVAAPLSARAANCLSQSISCYQRLIRLYPDRLAAHFNLARLHLENGDETAAGEAFERVLTDQTLHYKVNDLLFWREFQDDSFAYEKMMLSVMEHVKDRNHGHLRAIERMIRDSALLSLAGIRSRLESPAAARRLFEQHPCDATECPALWLSYAQVHSQGGNHAEAARGIREAIRLDRAIVTSIPATLLREIESAEPLGAVASQRKMLGMRRAA